MLIGWKTARVRLWVGSPHQSGLGSNTVRVSGTRSTIRNGPVPLVLRLAKVPAEVPRTTSIASFASSHSLSMIQNKGRFWSRVGSGTAVTISISWSPSLLMTSIEVTAKLISESGSRIRSNEASTSSAVNGLPFW